MAANKARKAEQQAAVAQAITVKKNIKKHKSPKSNSMLFLDHDSADEDPRPGRQHPDDDAVVVHAKHRRFKRQGRQRQGVDAHQSCPKAAACRAIAANRLWECRGLR